MITDVVFLQKYNETILENFSSVLKQNMIFQTQIALLEEKVSKLRDYEEIKSELNRLNLENNDLKNELHHKNMILENNVNVDANKHRLQTALNNEMREKKKYQSLYEEDKEYIKQLENMLPNSKRKKLGLEVEEKSTELKEEQQTVNVDSVVESAPSVIEELAGGSF